MLLDLSLVRIVNCVTVLFVDRRTALSSVCRQISLSLSRQLPVISSSKAANNVGGDAVTLLIVAIVAGVVALLFVVAIVRRDCLFVVVRVSLLVRSRLLSLCITSESCPSEMFEVDIEIVVQSFCCRLQRYN